MSERKCDMHGALIVKWDTEDIPDVDSEPRCAVCEMENQIIKQRQDMRTLEYDLDAEIRKQGVAKMSKELKPCPFCGYIDDISISATGFGPVSGEDVLDFKTVQCADCGALVCGGTEQEAITAWNQRQPDNAQLEAKLTKIKVLTGEAENHRHECECLSCRIFKIIGSEKSCRETCPVYTDWLKVGEKITELEAENLGLSVALGHANAALDGFGKANECVWDCDDGGLMNTGCGHKDQVPNNSQRYCCFCGKHIRLSWERWPMGTKPLPAPEAKQEPEGKKND